MPSSRATDVEHDRQGALSQHERRSRGLRPRHEQRDRADAARDVDRYIFRQGQGAEAIHLLVGQAQWLLAGGKDADRRCFAPQGGDDFRHAFEQVLAVVENEQHPASTQGLGEIDGVRLRP